MSLGNVLPTAKSIEATKKHAEEVEARKRKTGLRLDHCKKIETKFETRYYDTPTTYAIVNATGQILRFEVREDGDYSI